MFSDSSSCGAHFELGKLYFVCASKQGARDSLLLTNRCDSGPFELALEARLGLGDPIVLDDELAESRPSESELEVMAEGADPVLARVASKVLAAIRLQKSSSGTGRD